MPAAKLNDNELLRMLASDDRTQKNKAFKQLHLDYYGLVESLIITNSGTTDSVPELFNDVLLALYKSANNPDFKLTSTLKTYLYSIARRCWLATLRKQRNNKEVQLTEVYNQTTPVKDSVIKKIELKEHETVLQELLLKLKDDCTTIIKQFYFLKWRMKKIAKHYEKSEDAVKLQKSRCLKRLRALVTENEFYTKNLKLYLNELSN